MGINNPWFKRGAIIFPIPIADPFPDVPGHVMSTNPGGTDRFAADNARFPAGVTAKAALPALLTPKIGILFAPDVSESFQNASILPVTLAGKTKGGCALIFATLAPYLTLSHIAIPLQKQKRF